MAVDIKDIVFLCAQTLCRLELELQSLQSSMINRRGTQGCTNITKNVYLICKCKVL